MTDRYYELTGETLTTPDGVVLHRIRALINLPAHDVRAGDLGGWIEEPAQLYGDAWVSDDAQVSGSARVSDDARVFGRAWVSDDAQVSGRARVSLPQHILTIGPIGSENIHATLFRTETGHTLNVGCWTGAIDTLPAEVERRAQHWQASDETKTRWRTEYDTLRAPLTARAASWHQGGTK